MRQQIPLQPPCHKGTSILEAIAVLAIVGSFLSCVVPNNIDRINRAKYEKMINEMTSIAQASIDFYNSQFPNTWPMGIGQLAPKYLYQVIAVSPWGGNYVLSFQDNLVLVTTTIPTGIAQKNPEGSMLEVVSGSSSDQITIAQRVPNENIASLQYEKKHTHNQ